MQTQLAKEESSAQGAGASQEQISSRAGFMPISLRRLPIRALTDIPVYRRRGGGGKGSGAAGGDPFTLFRAGNVSFDEESRQRLLEHNVRFIYIPISFHEQFRAQTESQIQQIVLDPAMAASAKWDIVYETSAELANELLSQQNLGAAAPRLQLVSQAVAKLVLNDPAAFAHLFATSHHDFYTATHMVNVAAWMVALAYAQGIVEEEKLGVIFQAGMLHDVGKTLVPKEILNKTEPLTGAEWTVLRRHPVLGCDYLKDCGVTDPLILAVTRQHHERLDGSGYPDGLKGNQIHPVSRDCAIVDTFDALTALRPFKSRAVSVSEAMEVIFHDTPLRYDSKVVGTWTELVKTVDPTVGAPAEKGARNRSRRRFDRFAFNCPVLVLLKSSENNGDLMEAPPIGAVAHNLSCAGIGLLMPVPLTPGVSMKLHLQPPKWIRVKKTYDAVCVRCRAYDDGWYEIGVAFDSDQSKS